MSASRTFDVTAADTARALGSGDVEVLGTPRLLAWLEGVTVTAFGGRVTVTAEVTGVPGDRLTFAVSATDPDDQLLAVGEIDRAVVARTEFG